MYLSRRVVRMASEDIGLADPRALQLALSAKDAYHFLGSPEGELALVEAVVFLATAPKSNRIYKAWSSAQQAAFVDEAEVEHEIGLLKEGEVITKARGEDVDVVPW